MDPPNFQLNSISFHHYTYSIDSLMSKDQCIQCNYQYYQCIIPDIQRDINAYPKHTSLTQHKTSNYLNQLHNMINNFHDKTSIMCHHGICFYRILGLAFEYWLIPPKQRSSFWFVPILLQFMRLKNRKWTL